MMARKLEHVWRKRGQQSILQLPFGECGVALVGAQSHGTTMVLEALQEAVMRPTHNNYLMSATMASPDEAAETCALALHAFSMNGTLLSLRSQYSRSSVVLLRYVMQVALSGLLHEDHVDEVCVCFVCALCVHV